MLPRSSAADRGLVVDDQLVLRHAVVGDPDPLPGGAFVLANGEPGLPAVTPRRYRVPSAPTNPFPFPLKQPPTAPGGICTKAGAPVSTNVLPPSSYFEHTSAIEAPARAPPPIEQR